MESAEPVCVVLVLTDEQSQRFRSLMVIEEPDRESIDGV
jgi:hypothetical protein